MRSEIYKPSMTGFVAALLFLMLTCHAGGKEAGSQFGSSGDLAVYSPLAEASASSFLDDKTNPANVLDGNVRTGWRPKDEVLLPNPPWLQVDLGSIQRLVAVVLDAGLGYYHDPPLLPLEFTVEVSADGQDYRKVAERREVVEPRVPLELSEAVEARYVRVNVLKQWRNKPCTVAELEVYGRIPPGGLMPYDIYTSERFLPRSGQVRSLDANLQRAVLRLGGEWEFRLDPDEVGETQGWFGDSVPFPERIQVPGNWNAQGFGGMGNCIGLNWDGTPHRGARIRGAYYGPAWYRKKFPVAKDWAGQRIMLKFAGVMPNLKLWVNGEFVGARYTSGLSVIYDISEFIKPGTENQMVVVIDNRETRTALHSHLQSYALWGGIYDSVELEARAATGIQNVLILPDLDRHGASLRVDLSNARATPTSGEIRVEVLPVAGLRVQPYRANLGVELGPQAAKTIELFVPMPGAKLWSVDSPFLYRATIRFETPQTTDGIVERFGLREVKAKDGRVLFNGRPLYTRGIHFSYFFYDTLSPWTSIDQYREVLRRYRAYGFNYLRTPLLLPRDFFDAADEVGILIQPSADYVSDYVYQFAPSFLTRLFTELVRQHGNHPSIVAYELSNEKWHSAPYLTKLYDTIKQLDPTRLAIDSDGVEGPPRPTADVWLPCAILRARNWEPYMREIADTTLEAAGKPIIEHEYLNLPTLPDVRLIERFNQATLPPSALVGLKEWLESASLLPDYPQYLASSYRLQAIFFKEGIETLRKNPAREGYSVTSFTDVETVAHWAILDSYFGQKGISPEECREYNDETVMLVNLPGRPGTPFLPRYTYYYGETIPIEFLISHYGHLPVKGATLEWVLAAGGQVLKQGTMGKLSAPPYRLTSLAKTEIPAIELPAPQKVTLRVTLRAKDQEFGNHWDLWFFPRVAAQASPAGILALGTSRGPVLRQVTNLLTEWEPKEELDLVVTDHLEEKVLDYALGGGRVLLLSLADLPNVETGFWPGWFLPGDRNLGVLVRKHPALGNFPHDGIGDWGFGSLLHRAAIFAWRTRPMSIQSSLAGGTVWTLLDPEFRPAKMPVQIADIVSGVVNDYDPKAIAHLFEVGIGDKGGKLLACGFNLNQDTPEARYLLAQLLRYTLSEDFSPRFQSTREQWGEWAAVKTKSR